MSKLMTAALPPIAKMVKIAAMIMMIHPTAAVGRPVPVATQLALTALLCATAR